MIKNSLFAQEFLQEHHVLKDVFYKQKKLSAHDKKTIQAFQDIILHFYRNNRRSFAWREIITPYRVIVSEIMLQQTQTDRVIDKFNRFVQIFPDFQTLAQAPFQEILLHWKGLGYNRRALALQKIAMHVLNDYAGIVPNDTKILESWPSIGKATARSIITFAFNEPTVFIETNVRTVFIYFFFPNRQHIDDKEIEPLVEQSVDNINPRDWYYALMDYGVMIKKTVGNLSRWSKHHSKQSRFEGSDRQIRGAILQELLDKKSITCNDLCEILHEKPERIMRLMYDLQKEGFLVIDNEHVYLQHRGM